MKNVIILGPGRTGSSFLSGLIARNRFYINREAILEREGYPDGDYENPDLVDLNKDIFFESGYGHHKVKYNKNVDIGAMKALHENEDITKYKEIIKKCQSKKPWLWKDPRLCYTIHFWGKLLDFSAIKLIFIEREIYQIFRSYTKHKVFFTKKDVYRKYDDQVLSVNRFLKENNFECLNLNFDDLKDKQKLIDTLNNYLETDISLDDYNSIHRANITKKEPEIKFWLRYGLGVAKLKFDRVFQK